MVKHFLSNNFSICVDKENKLVRKEPLDGVSVLQIADQQKHYKKMKEYFKDTYVDTWFVHDNDAPITAYSPLIPGELLCNLQNLNTPQLKQLVDFQKKIILYALYNKEWIDFFGSDPDRPLENRNQAIKFHLHKLLNSNYSTNIVINEQNDVYYIDTFHIESPHNIKKNIYDL